MHIANFARHPEWLGVAVAVARIHDGVAGCRVRHVAREILPHRHRAEPLVQEHERGTALARELDALILEAMAADVDERHSDPEMLVQQLRLREQRRTITFEYHAALHQNHVAIGDRG